MLALFFSFRCYVLSLTSLTLLFISSAYPVIAFKVPLVFNVHIIKEMGDMFVVSCTRGYEEKIILALSFIKKLQNTPISVCTLKTSGTLKAITRYAELVKSKVSEVRVSEST